MDQLGSTSYATWEVQCRLCLKKVDDIGEYVEITQKINQTILEIFPPDLVRFQSDSIFICEQCLEMVETCTSFRSEIVEKHQKQEQQLLAVVKNEYEVMDSKAVVIKTELEEEFEEYFTDFVSAPDDEPTSWTNEPPAIQYIAHATQKPQQNHAGEVIQSIQCPNCPRMLKSNDILQKHIERVHPQPRTCHICQQVLSSQRYLEHHIKVVHMKVVINAKRNELVTCEICDKTMKRGSLDIHRAAHTKETWRFSCDLCGKKYRQKTHIVDHVKSHILMEFREKKHQCSICEKRFHREDHLFYHLRTEHKIQPESHKSHECHCGKSFKHRNLLRAHMEHIHNREKFQKSCEVCGKVIASQYELNFHMKTHHSNGVKDIECNVCGMKFMLKKRLTTHLREVHGEKKFVCDFDGCGKKFTRRPRMEMHKKTIHLKKNDFKCTYIGCGKEYQRKTALMGHFKLVHENRRQNCPITGCDFQTGRRQNMKIHLKKHTELTSAEMSEAVENVKQMELVS